MKTELIISTIETCLDDLQAIDLLNIHVAPITTITDQVIICTGRSSRHVKSMAKHLIETLKKAGTPVIGSSGVDNGEWALIDVGDVVVHIMLADVRAFYNLEGVWQMADNQSSIGEN